MLDQSVRIGIDVGGTFTDVLLIDSSGRRWHTKVQSTPEDSSLGVLEGLQQVLDKAGFTTNQITHLLHGTTVATNTVLQRKGSRVSLITTKGFEDILEIGRQQRPALYDLLVDRVPPLVPRERCFGVAERITSDGQILTALTKTEITRVLRSACTDVDAVAICLLFAFRNSNHESQLGTQIGAKYPNLPVSLSSRVLPEFREYERISTTVLDAYVKPILHHYLKRLKVALTRVGVSAPLLLMQSHGGVLQSTTAHQHSARLLFSGLAGGALGGRYSSQVMDIDNVISFDMGGTSTDVSLIQNGVIEETSEGSIGGLPCSVPMVDVETVGAGGGSIAWVDDGGVLRVGPHSAGANPGPCCYDIGGQEPTVTDANLLLGRLNSHYFVGGQIPLNPEPAERQIRKLAKRLRLDVTKCAFGILRVVNANMERAIRVVSVQRGYDPRDFALVAFGGAGPMHAWALAKELSIPRVIIPLAPGLHSALGLLATHLRVDQSQTVLQSTTTPNLKLLAQTYKRLENHLRQLLLDQGVARQLITLQRRVDMRYEGQAYELTLLAPKGRLSLTWVTRLREDFDNLHKRRYGYATPEAPTTIVNLRVIASGPMQSLKPPKIPLQGNTPVEPKEKRLVFFEETGDFIKTPIYERSMLGIGATLHGPVIIEQLDSTTIVHPESKATVRKGGNLVLEVD